MRGSSPSEIRLGTLGHHKVCTCLFLLLLWFTGADAFRVAITKTINDVMNFKTQGLLDNLVATKAAPPPPPASPPKPSSSYILTWETDVEAHIRTALEHRDPSSPFMVGVCGIPGSGKSCSSEILTANLQDVGCTLIPADGYHYYKKDLEAKENCTDLLWRRGAPDTFDAQALYNDLKAIREGVDEECIFIPGFSHAEGDPTPNAHCFNRFEHKVVVCEGLYLLHESDGFDNVRDLFDVTIFVDACIDRCMDRLKIRNRCIPGYTPEEIEFRVDDVDRINAETVHRSSKRAHLVVPSATTAAKAQ